jgi:hypothetical protein
MPVADGEIVDIVGVGIHAPGRDFVQQRFPDVCFVAVDQRDIGTAAPSELVAQGGGQRQSAGAAADDHDSVRCRGSAHA